MNKKDPNCTFGMNKFTDLSQEEFITKYTGWLPDLGDSDTDGCKAYYDSDILREVQRVPKAWDWREHIQMFVKDQMTCGSCWAFAATGNVEAQYAINNNKYSQPVSLSEQQLLDCEKKSLGCGGGYPTQALRYLVQVGGQELESAYPYFNMQGSCKFNPANIQVKVDDCITFRLTSEDMIKKALYKYGPLIAVVDATNFQTYKGGILSNCLFQSYNHAVLIVGYGQVLDKKFWIIKNSWGTWGEGGYGRIQRGENSCGILTTNIATSVHN